MGISYNNFCKKAADEEPESNPFIYPAGLERDKVNLPGALAAANGATLVEGYNQDYAKVKAAEQNYKNAPSQANLDALIEANASLKESARWVSQNRNANTQFLAGANPAGFNAYGVKHGITNAIDDAGKKVEDIRRSSKARAALTNTKENNRSLFDKLYAAMNPDKPKMPSFIGKGVDPALGSVASAENAEAMYQKNTPWYQKGLDWLGSGTNGLEVGAAGLAGILAGLAPQKRSLLTRLLLGLGAAGATYGGIQGGKWLYDKYKESKSGK